MQHRVPVLATAAPTFAEILEGRDLGIMVEPDNLEALVNGIALLHDRLATGREFAFEDYLSQFSWAENARRTVAVYQSLLQ